MSSKPEERKGLYRSKLIQKTVNAMWFSNRRDEGVMYPDCFNPFPLNGLALVLAAVYISLRSFLFRTLNH